MIDIHNNSERLDNLKNLINNSTKIRERNKLLLFKFSADCQTRWSEKKPDMHKICDRISYC